MDFRQLQYILKVAECGSITKAASELYIAQPSLSNYIAKTERELNVILFDRSSSPLRLTFAGEEYVKDAKKILYLSDQMRKKLSDISTVTRDVIKVGISYERGCMMFPLIIPKFKQYFPSTEVQITTGGIKRLNEELQAGNLDFYILPTPVQDGDKEYIQIYREELILCAGAGIIREEHLMPGHQDIVDISKCGSLPMVMLEEGRAVRDAVDALLAGHSIRPSISFTSYSLSLAVRMAALGAGITIAPRLTLELTRYDPSARIYSLGKPPVYWEVCAVYRKDSYLGNAERAFIDIASQAFHSYSELLERKRFS